jgi:glycosyltransferase involved in cell wall biosynthesis
MISVIIPTYNHASSLNACVDSLLAQKGVELEVIIVDDGSTDETADVLKEYVQIDHVTIILQENQGSNPARNNGAQRATGKYIIFADADSVFVEDALNRLRDTLENEPTASFAYSDFRFGWKQFKSGEYDVSRLSRMNYIHTSALIRRSDFPGFDNDLSRFQDWDLWLTLMKNGKHGSYVPGELFRITVERSGISSWLPKNSYRAPWRWLPGIRQRVEAYESAKNIVLEKHGLKNDH